MRIAITYLLDDIIYNVILPCYEISLARYETSNHDDALSLYQQSLVV